MSASQEEIAEAFEIFDRDNDGKISKGEVATAIRALGKNPTNKEINKLLEGVGNDVDLQTFSKIYNKKMTLANEQKQPMLDAFKSLDKENKGTIEVSQLRNILVSLGDSLSKDEVDDLFKECNVSGNTVKYADLVDKLVSKYALKDRPKPLKE